jgi:hypothetical protein
MAVALTQNHPVPNPTRLTKPPVLDLGNWQLELDASERESAKLDANAKKLRLRQPHQLRTTAHC